MVVTNALLLLRPKAKAETDTKQTNTHLTASFPGQPGEACNRKVKSILHSNEARDDWVAVASVGPYANHLRLTADG